MKRFKKYEAVCKAIGRDPKFLPDTTGMSEHDAKSQVLHFKVTGVVDAYNEGWVADWKDANQEKFIVWFDMGPSPSGFSLNDVSYCYSLSSVASRLCFRSREVAKAAVADHKALFKEYMYT